MMTKQIVLCVVRLGDQLLLGLKKRRIGEGFWTLPGGKKEGSETAEQTAVRELREECGIEVRECRKVGVITVIFENNPTVWEETIVVVSSFSGEVKETEELLGKWHSIAAIPFEKIWIDNPLWLPLALEGKEFEGEVVFSGKNLFHPRDEIVRHDVRVKK